MSCSIMSKKVQLLLGESETTFDLVLGIRRADVASLEGLNRAQLRLESFRSALQNPDLSRAQLSTMLRKAARKQTSKKAQNTYWNAFMSSYVTQNANSNAA